MTLNLIPRMKHYSWHRPHGLYTVTGAVFATALLASCSSEADKSGDIIEVDTVTLEECLAIQTQPELQNCLLNLAVQREAEAAAQKARIAHKKRENAAKRTQIIKNDQVVAEQESEIAELDTTIVVLTKEADEAIQRLEDRILEPQE